MTDKHECRKRDDKGNFIYGGNVLYDTTNKKFYWVKDAVRGILVTVEENPREVLIDEVKKVAYLKRWIFNRKNITLKNTLNNL